MKKFKRNFDVNAWLESINKFKNEIDEIEKRFNISIKYNENGNSIYFNKDGKEYRISTHDKINKEYSTAKDLFKDENQVNIVTNSRNNIIKNLLKILEK